MSETTTQTFDASDLQSAAWGTYKDLVLQTAKGSRPEPSEIQSTCWPIGRSLEQFQSDVSRSVRRLEAAADLERADAMSGEIEAAKADETAAANRLAEAESEAKRLVDEAAMPLAEAREKRERLESEQSALAKPARMVLANTADATFDTEISAVESSGAGLTNAQAAGREAAHKLQFQKEKVAELQRMATNNSYPMPPPGDCKREAAEIESGFPKLQERIAAGERATERLAEIERQTNKLREEKLQPKAMAW